MDFNFDTGSIYGGLQTLDVTALPPLGGTAGVLSLVGDGALILLQGGNATRPVTPAGGMFRYNTDSTVCEYYNGVEWTTLSTGGGTLTSVAASTTSTGLSISGSPITSAGEFVFTLNTELQGLAGLSTTGLVARTGTGAYTPVTITGTSGNITVTNGEGTAGNPTVDLATVSQASSGSFVKVTLDGYGRVTGNTAVITSDITALVDSTYVNVTGDTMSSGANLTFVGGGEVLGLPATPSGATAATSKQYVDSVAAGLSWKQAVILGTTVNVDLSIGGLIPVDGITPADGDRVLVKNQSSLSENGIYIAHLGSWVRSTDMDTTTPINEVNGAAVYVTQGNTQANTGWTQIDNVVTLGTDPIEWTQFTGVGTYSAGAGLSLVGNVFSLSSPVSVAHGGTGLTASPTNGQLLIGDGTGYTLAGLTAGTGITVTPASGAITIANSGVTALAGTTGQITASASTGSVTLSIPSTFVAPGSVEVTTTLTVDTLTANGALYASTGGQIVSTAAMADGEILIGATGLAPAKATITAGTGVVVTNGANSITLSADTTALVSTFSAGTTGFTPNTATSGAITLSGTLAITNGGTGLTASGTANQILGVNGAATGLEYKTVSAGTGISVTQGANVVTIANTGVTSVALSDASTTPIYSISGSPVTTTGTLTFTLQSQTANTIFAAPAGSSGQPSFRGLVFADLSGAIKLYAENPSTPTAPSAVGANAVAIGSGSTATAIGSFAVGDGSNATVWGGKAYANGDFATAGDAQKGLYVLRNITTDATVTDLYLDGVVGTERLVVGNDSLWTFDILVAARRTDAVGGGAGYRFVGIVRKDATSGSITFVGTPSKTVIGETNGAWDVTLTADTSNGDLRISVKGEAAKTIRWVATVDTAEVTD